MRKWFAYREVPHQCGSGNLKKGNNQVRRLSLKDLTGAFIVLIVGYGISLVVFMVEKVTGQKI